MPAPTIPAKAQTMNLEAFTMNTPESEFHRVVRHETGHTLGFPHEHMRKALVDKIDPQKALEFFGRTQGVERRGGPGTGAHAARRIQPTRHQARSELHYVLPNSRRADQRWKSSHWREGYRLVRFWVCCNDLPEEGWGASQSGKSSGSC